MKRAVFMVLAALPSTVLACPDYLDSELRKLHSSDSINLCEAYGGKPMLVVNTASRCGFTGQFEALESLYQEYREQGLAVVGFASDDFNQEADTEEEAANVCRVNHGVTFTMIAPTAVTGADANPVFAMLGEKGESPGWNFHKYVLDGDGDLVASFPSRVTPDDQRLRDAVNSVLE